MYKPRQRGLRVKSELLENNKSTHIKKNHTFHTTRKTTRKTTHKTSRATIWNPLSKIKNTNSRLSNRNISNISSKLDKLFYNAQDLGYTQNLEKNFEILKFYLALIMERARENKEINKATQNSSNKSNNSNKNNKSNKSNKYNKSTRNLNDDIGYFIITEEMNYWYRDENKDVWTETLMKPNVLQTCRKLLSLSNDQQAIDKLESINRNFNIVYDNESLKKHLLDKKLKQTWLRNNPNIKVLFYNSNFRSNFYFNTPALIKNNLESNSLNCIKYKDFLYQNLIIMDNMNHNFLPYSIVIKSGTDITFRKISSKFKKFYEDYSKLEKHILLTTDNLADDIYVVRSVEYIDYHQFTASMGFGIIIIKSQEDIDTKLKPLYSKFNTFIISKFIQSKLVKLSAYDPYTKQLIPGHINYSIRITFISLLTLNPLNPKNNQYELWHFICKKGKFLTSTHFIDRDNDNNKSELYDYYTDNLQMFDTHHGIYTLIFEPNDKNEINANYDRYYEQIVKIIEAIGEVLKYRVKIYPECEHGFEEFTIDLMLGSNDILYLAEVNNNSNVNEFNSLEPKLRRKQKQYGFNDEVFKEILESKIKSYTNFNNSIFSIIYDGIINPILDGKPIEKKDTEFYTSICISDNVASIPRFKNGNFIPIK